MNKQLSIPKPAHTIGRLLIPFHDQGLPKPGSTTYRILAYLTDSKQLRVMSTMSGAVSKIRWRDVEQGVRSGFVILQ